jgi:pantoate--beta-alanine ligase
MIIFKKPADIQNFIKPSKLANKKIGFTPTMGALHAGHISLVEAAKKENDIVISSIFVNPTQFNDPEDFKKYPITLDKDIAMFESAGCNVLFIPTINDIYPGGTNNLRYYDLGYLETVLEGKFRPGHFQGVCQVVHRLLEIVMPDNLYLGQKDYQQCMVIKRLIQLVGLDSKIKVNICPTLREDDGLAMSSRNVRLSSDERKKATTISAALQFIKQNIKEENISPIKEKARQMLLEKDFKIDYAEIADANTLEIIENWDGKQKIVALVAAFLGNVRLIDNMVLNP